MFYAIVLLLTSFMVFAADSRPKPGEQVPEHIIKLLKDFDKKTESGSTVAVKGNNGTWDYAHLKVSFDDYVAVVINPAGHGLVKPTSEIKNIGQE